MVTVLITGGLGFIGLSTARRLAASGYKILLLDNVERQVHHGKVPFFPSENITFENVNILEYQKLRKYISQSDYILHLAALTGSSQSFWQPRKYTNTNTLGTSNIYDILVRDKNLRKRIQKIVVASSSYVYGEGTYMCKSDGIQYPSIRPPSQITSKNWDIKCPKCGGNVDYVSTNETKEPQAPNPYSLSKLYTEKISQLFSEAIEIPTVCFRYFNVIGPGQSLFNPYTGVASIFMSRLKEGKSPIIFEDGGTGRDFVNVSDVSYFNELALSKGQGIYNVGSGELTSINSLNSILQLAMDTKIDPIYNGESRMGDIRMIFSDNSKLFSDFGNHNFIDMKASINELVEWGMATNSKDSFDKAEIYRKKFIG